MKKLQHVHILLKAQIREPKALSLEGLENWMDKTVREQKLEPVLAPRAVNVDDPGNEGPTGSVNIKTSHMAFHIWEKLGVIQADLYTCGDLDVLKFLDAFELFDPIKIEYLVLDRAEGFKILESGTLDLSHYSTIYPHPEDLEVKYGF